MTAPSQTLNLPLHMSQWKDGLVSLGDVFSFKTTDRPAALYEVTSFLDPSQLGPSAVGTLTDDSTPAKWFFHQSASGGFNTEAAPSHETKL